MKLVIIEDEEKLARHLKTGFKQEGYSVDYCLDGLSGQKYIELNQESLDLIILDLLIPGKNGLEVCKNLRNNNITLPILMLTVKNSTDDKIAGLDAGADDYITKPFSFDELMARVKALLRRPKYLLPDEIKIGNLLLNPSERKVFYGKKEFFLTLKEFNLLEYFMRNPNQVLTREQILDKLWDLDFDSFSNVVDVHIKNLRKKLEILGNYEILETIRGVGYRLKS